MIHLEKVVESHCSAVRTDAFVFFTETYTDIYCMDYNVDGTYLATGGESMDIHVYDAKNYKVSHSFTNGRVLIFV